MSLSRWFRTTRNELAVLVTPSVDVPVFAEWQPGDVIVFGARYQLTTALTTQGLHLAIGAYQAATGRRDAARYGHVAVYAGDGTMWQSTRARGVHCCPVLPDCLAFDLVLRRWRPQGSTDAEIAEFGRQVVDYCSQKKGTPYDKWIAAELVQAHLRFLGQPAEAEDALICSQLVHTAYLRNDDNRGRYRLIDDVSRPRTANRKPMPADFMQSQQFKTIVYSKNTISTSDYFDLLEKLPDDCPDRP